ncbi:MAG: 50S ribosomal protein L10 [Chitinivibrionales bacterium]
MSTRTERTQVIEALEKEFVNATGIYLTDFNGVDVEKVTKLRSNLRVQGARYLVVKNTLARIALERCGDQKGELIPFLKGPTGVAVTQEESTGPAKIIKDFRKEFKNLLDLKVAYVDGSLFDAEQADQLANLPSREVLLAQLLSVLKAPMTNLAGSLNGIMSKFVRTLDAVRQKKEAE